MLKGVGGDTKSLGEALTQGLEVLAMPNGRVGGGGGGAKCFHPLE